MREIRLPGSEGGAMQSNALSLPLSTCGNVKCLYNSRTKNSFISGRLFSRYFFLPRMEIVPPLFEAAGGYCRPHLLHQAQIEVEVVYCVQAIGQEFAADKEVAQVCAGEAAACVAAAIRVDEARVLGVCVVLYVNEARAR